MTHRGVVAPVRAACDPRRRAPLGTSKAAQWGSWMTPTPKKSTPAPVLAVTDDKSARAILRDYIREQIEMRDSFHLSELTQQTVEALQKNDTFVKLWLEETLPSAAQSEVQQVVASTRRHQVLGDYAATPEKVDERVVRFKSRWSNWREHAGDYGHITLAKMKPLHLREAARERMTRGRTEIVLGKLMMRLSQELRETEEVGARFTDEEIERMYQEINSQEQEV